MRETLLGSIRAGVANGWAYIKMPTSIFVLGVLVWCAVTWWQVQRLDTALSYHEHQQAEFVRRLEECERGSRGVR